MIQLFRNNVPTIKLPLTQQVIFNHEIMGDKSVVFDIKLPTVIDVRTGDYMVFETDQFELNNLPNYTKESNWSHQYRLKFESIIFRLYKKRFMLDGETIFPFFGTAREHLELVVSCMNDIDPGWSVGTVDETEPLPYNWNGVSCRVALTNIAELFKLEWSNNGKELNMVKQVGRQTTISLSYGKGNGLYNLSRQSVDNTQIVTRMYGYGGTRNLPVSYGGRRLKLPESYLETNVDLYGIIEDEYVNEEIFPKREATLTGVSEITADTRVFTVVDTTINFNINDYLLEGVAAKIGFNSGDLTGYEFEIKSYNNTTKTLTVKSDVSDNDRVMPNTALKPAIGDKYVLLDINMPEIHLTEAINKLRTATQESLDTNKWPQVVYSFNSDVLDMKRKGWRLNPGDIVNLTDEGINLDNDVRVYAVSYPLTFALQGRLEPGTSYTATLADSIPYTAEEKIIKDTIDNQKGIVVVDRRNAERARRNAYNLRQLSTMIFDPDGETDGSTLSPTIIQAMMGRFGALSQNFGLNGVEINANTDGNPNHLTLTGGSLIHYDRAIEGLGYIWQMQAASFPGLTPSKSYYLSAKCSRTVLTGTWYLSETPVKTDDEAGFWHFNLGVLYSVKDGYRNFDFTNGVTYIVGDRIKTGTIESLDGLTVLGLTDGSLKLGDLLKFNTTENPGTLEITGKINVLPGGNAATKGDVNNVAVGGRNYVLATEGSRSLTFAGGNNEVKYLYPLKAGFYGREITLHFDYAINNTAPFTSNSRFVVQVQKTTVSGYLHGLTPNIVIAEANKVGHYKRTVTLNLPSGVTLNDTVYIHVSTYAITGSITFSNFKLEVGNKETDWTAAPEDVNQSIEAAKQQAQNAQNTADIAASKTSFLQTTIDGNVVATGTVLVGDALGNQNGGITGIVDPEAASSVREWYGVPFANRYTAPWRIYNDGSMVALKGRIGELNITEMGYLTNNEAKGGFRFDNRGTPEYETEGYKGVTAGAALSINLIMAIENRTPGGTCLQLSSNYGNALDLFGGIRTRDGQGKTFIQDIGGGFGIKFVDGIYVGTVEIENTL